jgi:uncharacterized repeat protein (TIGR03803 family)
VKQNFNYISSKRIFKNLLFFIYFLLPFGLIAQSKLWSVATYGGSYNAGTVFNIDTAGNFNLVKDFSILSGPTSPTGGLVEANGLYYGMTFGGTLNYGVIYSYDRINSVFTTLTQFDSINGQYPVESLIHASNGNLYGVTMLGGVNNEGVLFEFNPTNNSFTKLYDFISSTGSLPSGSLLQASNGLLYGVTNSGGTTGRGVLYSFDLSGNSFSTLFNFDSTNGSYPSQALIESNGLFYGVAGGGTSSNGVIYSFDIATSTYNKLYDFDGLTGTNPSSPLFETSSGVLFGTTSSGGNFGEGVLFSYNPDSNIFIKFMDFDDLTNGGHPRGALTQMNNGSIFGTTFYGGANYGGVIYSFHPTNTFISVLYEFGTSSGGLVGSLIEGPNSILYGVADESLPFDGISLWSYNTIGHFYTSLVALNSTISDGATPKGSLILASDGKLYGITYDGGHTVYDGVIYSIDPVTNSYTPLLDDFHSMFCGYRSYGNLCEATNGKMYGVLNNCSDEQDFVFCFDPTVNEITHCQFLGNNDCEPSSPLMQAANGLLYGTQLTGGNLYGLIFTLDPSNNSLSYIYNFDYTNGSDPKGTILQASNGLLYGITSSGGLNDLGVIYSYDITGGNIFTNVYDFDTINGTAIGSLIQATNGLIYGMTNFSGINSQGTIFSFDLNTLSYTKLFDFDSLNGTFPRGTLYQASDGFLYGMTQYGGIYDKGVLFKFDPSSNNFTKLRNLNDADGIQPLFTSFVEVPDSINGLSEIKENEVKVFPNPSNGNFTVDLGKINSEKTKIELYDLMGKKIFETITYNKNKVIIDCKSSPGMYVMTITNNKNQNIKLIIE